MIEEIKIIINSATLRVDQKILLKQHFDVKLNVSET